MDREQSVETEASADSGLASSGMSPESAALLTKPDPALERLQEILARREELDPALALYVDNLSPLGYPCLRHPLVYAVPYFDVQNALYNEQYRTKRMALERAREKKDWTLFVFLHECPWRLQAFLEIATELTDSFYWDLLSSLWSDSENIWQNRRYWSMLLRSRRPEQEQFMVPSDREFFSALPEKFLVFRGHQKKNRRGLSWTLSLATAQFFETRYWQSGGILSTLVAKDDVIGFIGGRNEWEIVLRPGAKITPKTLRLPHLPEELVRVEAASIEKFRLKNSYHGPAHWRRVDRNAINLAAHTPAADLTVCRLFALLHDSCRINEETDPKHGHRAAKFAAQLFDSGTLKITAAQLEVLCEACRRHNDGKVSDDPTVGVCWDADRLDLVRVGIAPDRKLLSTKAAKQFLWQL